MHRASTRMSTEVEPSLSRTLLSLHQESGSPAAGRLAGAGNLGSVIHCGNMYRIVQMCACGLVVCAAAAFAQNAPAAGAASDGIPSVSGDDTTAGFQKSFLGSLAYGPKEFPHIWQPYVPHP